MRPRRSTERRVAETNLRRLATVVRDSNDAITIQDFDGRITAWNHGAESMYGYSEREALAASIDLLTTPGKVWEQQDFIRRLIAGEAVTSFETQRVTKDGRVLDVWMTVTKLMDEAGTPVGLASTERDITARKQAERALRAREQQLASIYDAAAESLFQLAVEEDGGYRFVSVNRAFALATGLRYEEVVGQRVEAVIPEPGLTLVREKYAQAIGERRIVRWEETSEYPTGRTTGEVSIAPVFDEAGQCTHLVGVVHDITERRLADANIRRMATVVRDSNDAITIQDFDGRITAWNHGAESMYGYSEREALAASIDRLTAPGKVEEQKDFIRRLIAGEAVTSFETQRVTKDGRVLDVWMTVTKLMDDAGTPVGLASTERDITERKQLEAQYLQAQKMESVGRLAGGVAHDFNNLLTVINSTAELAAMQLRPSDPLQQDLAEIRGAGTRAAGLTKQLLAFSRKQVLQPQAVNLTTLVADLQPLLQRLIGEDVALPVVLAKDLANVRVDPGQFEQVIVNLVVNARDAMPKGGTITTETRNVDVDDAYFRTHPSVQPGAYVMLALSDTGVGMDAATRQRIFEPFFTTKPPGKGTGLGLATVYGIVRQSGGSISVYSEVGKGTTFRIYLPRVADAAPEYRPARSGVVTRGTGTVLVVEDEEALRRVAQRILLSAGYTVLVAANGEEALRLLERHDHPVDLVLTDVVMPGMSGRDLAEQIRASHGGVKILFTSGYTDDAILRHGVLDAGVNFIAKPYSVADLTRKVREVQES